MFLEYLNWYYRQIFQLLQKPSQKFKMMFSEYLNIIFYKNRKATKTNYIMFFRIFEYSRNFSACSESATIPDDWL